jgi:hypothetical protein
MRKERFPEQRRSKLMPRGGGLYQIIERINDNAYKVDPPGEYGVSVTFNVSNLSSFDVGDDSRSNPFKEPNGREREERERKERESGAVGATSTPSTVGLFSFLTMLFLPTFSQH